MNVPFESLNDYLRLGWYCVGRADVDKGFVDVGKTDMVYQKMNKIVKSIDVLWPGWECDPRAWLIETDEGLEILTTKYGKIVKIDCEFLIERINFYKNVVKETEWVLEKMRGYDEN